MDKKILNVRVYFWLLFLCLSLLFILFPQIDLFVSNLFFDGKTFPANGTWAEEFLYHSVKPIIIIFALSSLAIFLYNYFKKKSILNINAKVLLYIFLVLGVAPGLIVNVILKENWGRPRPAQCTQFGGKLNFSPPFIPTKQDGYSFPSGHSAAAFSLIGFALLAKRKRKYWISLALTYGVVVSIARIASGGHFFSDVVTSFFIVYIFTYIFHMLIVQKD
jgi:lipid A 4'-phosphatase